MGDYCGVGRLHQITSCKLTPLEAGFGATDSSPQRSPRPLSDALLALYAHFLAVASSIPMSLREPTHAGHGIEQSIFTLDTLARVNAIQMPVYTTRLYICLLGSRSLHDPPHVLRRLRC